MDVEDLDQALSNPGRAVAGFVIEMLNQLFVGLHGWITHEVAPQPGDLVREVFDLVLDAARDVNYSVLSLPAHLGPGPERIEMQDAAIDRPPPVVEVCRCVGFDSEFARMVLVVTIDVTE